MYPNYLLSIAASAATRQKMSMGLATRPPARFVRRVGEVLWETGSAALLDRFAPQNPEIFEASPGLASPTASLALYLHWSPDGRISRMVRRDGFRERLVAAQSADEFMALLAEAESL